MAGTVIRISTKEEARVLDRALIIVSFYQAMKKGKY